jgi:BirA family biotin operon repressor/biotin-[acetyl-CoA-carboxylase] ligase
MAADGLAAAVSALPAGWRGHYHDVLESTQDEARRLARAGAPHRTVVVADYQHRGRGRQGRRWQAAAGQALLLSMVFRETIARPVPWRWTTLASVALCDAVEALSPACLPRIKWPNDVLLDDRKLAGVLAESTFDGQQLVAIVGVGVNVSTSAADLAAIGAPATSLTAASGQLIERGDLLQALLGQLTAWLARPEPELRAAWDARLWGRGQRVRLVDGPAGDQLVEVVVLGTAPDGALRVRLPDGAERTTLTGEILL